MIAAGSGLLAESSPFVIRLSDLKSDGYIDRTGSDHQSAFINGAFRTARSFQGQHLPRSGTYRDRMVGVPPEILPVNRNITRQVNIQMKIMSFNIMIMRVIIIIRIITAVLRSETQ